MARKKKNEPKPVEFPEVEQEQDVKPVKLPDTEYGEKELEDACFIPFENGFIGPEVPADETPTVAGDVEYTTTTLDTSKVAMTIEVANKHDMSYINDIGHAFEVIEKCNLYIWSGLDWGVGRIYEMARKEWSKYILDMYEWSDNGFKGNKPEKPSEVA